MTIYLLDHFGVGKQQTLRYLISTDETGITGNVDLTEAKPLRYEQLHG